VVERAQLESQKAAEVVVAQLAAAARKLPLANGLAVALPGPFDFATGVAWYRGQDKFDQLYGYNLGDSLREELALDRLMFMNDAEAFAVSNAASASRSAQASVRRSSPTATWSARATPSRPAASSTARSTTASRW